MIVHPDALAELIERIKQAGQIALDTEADSLHCYFEKLCLIQLGTGLENVLIDPLADLDLTPLFAVLSTKKVIFHGADYDLRLLGRVGAFAPADLFDTMIAAKLTGHKELGFAALVEKHFGVQLSKASQKANWALRPLSDRMKEYALNDVRYLIDLTAILEAELERLGRRSWFDQSCERMIQSARVVKERDDDRAWRITGSSALAPRAQAVLRALWFWRDAEARQWNRPSFHVIGNSDLLRIADQVVKGKPFSTPRFSNGRRQRFEQAIADALEIPESDWPVALRGERRRTTKAELDRFESLKKKRDVLALSLDIDASVLAARAALESVAADENSAALMPWQRQLLGLPTEQAHSHALQT